MNAFKHTPGPWLIVEKTDPVTISTWSIQIGDQSIGFFPYQYQHGDEEKSCGGYVNNPEMHANARLIAAAPELLEALQDAEQIDDLHRRMHRIEQRRPSGSFGIAAADDDDAIEWRNLVNKAAALISKRNSAIAKATKATKATKA